MKRLAKRTSIGLLFLLVLFTGLYLFRYPLISPFLRHTIEQAISDGLGVEVAIHQVQGTFLTELEVYGLTLKSSPTGAPVTNLALEKGVFRYWLPDLLAGRDSFLANLGVTLQGAELGIDLDRMGSDQEENGATWHPFPPELLPAITVEDSTLALRRQDLEVLVVGLAAQLQPPAANARGPARLTLEAADFQVQHPELPDRTVSLAARLEYSREHLVLRSLALNDRIVAAPFQLNFPVEAEEAFSWEADLFLFNGQVQLSGFYREDLLAASFEVEQLQLGELSGLLAPDTLSFGGVLEAAGSLQWHPGQPLAQAAGNLSFTLSEAALRAIRVERAVLKARTAAGNLQIEQFLLQAGANRLQLETPGLPVPALLEGDWQTLLESSRGQFAARFENIPSLLTMLGVALEELPSQLPAHTLQLQGQMGDRKLKVNKGFLATPSGRVEIEEASVELEPGGALQHPTLQALLTIQVPQLSELTTLFGLPSLTGSVNGRADLRGRLPELAGTAQLEGRDLSFRGEPLGAFSLAAQTDGERLELTSLEVQQNDNRVTGQGAYLFKEQRLEEARLQFDLAEIADYTRLFLPGQEITGNLSGRLQAAGPLLEPDLRLQAATAGAEIAGLPVSRGSLGLQSRGREILIEELTAITDQGSISLAGRLERGPEDRTFSGLLNRFSYTAPAGGDLFLQRPAAFRFERDGVYRVNGLLLKGTLGTVKADGLLQQKGPSDFRFSVVGLSGKGWLELLLEERLGFQELDLEMHLTGPLNRPQISLQGKAAELTIAELPFPLQANFGLNSSPAGVSIDRLEITGRDDFLLTITGQAPLNPLARNGEIFLPGELALSGRLTVPRLATVQPFAPGSLSLAGAAGGDLELSGNWQEPVGRLRFQGREVTVRHPSLPEPPGTLEISGDLQVEGARYRLRSLQVQSPFLSFGADGEWVDGPPLRRVLQGRDLQLGGRVAGRGRLEIGEIGWLARGITEIRRLEGMLQAQITMEGPIREPQIKGEVQLDDGELRTTMALPTLQALSLTAEVDSDTIRLVQGRGELGAAPFQLSGSLTRRPGQSPLLDLSLEGSNLLLARNEWLQLRADSSLRAQGPLAGLEVSGRLGVTDGYYRKDVDFLSLLRGRDRPASVDGLQLFSLREEPLSAMRFAVEISTAEPFRINNNVIRGKVRPELTLTGTGEVPALVGRIYVDETRIILPTGRLQVQSGLITFPANQPFRPRIDLLAQSTIRGYDISMQIEGSYNEPVVTLSSNPPLPQDDLLLLLLAGRTPQTATGREVARAGGTNIAVYFGKGLLAKWLGSDSPDDDESFFERLELEIGRGLTRQGGETLDAQFRMAEDLLRENDTLYLTAERDIYDDYNVGVKIVFHFE